MTMQSQLINPLATTRWPAVGGKFDRYVKNANKIKCVQRSPQLSLSHPVILHSLSTSSLPQPVKFRAERCTDEPANCVFSGHMTSILNTMRFDENPFTCQSEKEDKKRKEKKRLKGFKFRTFCESFSKNIMAVKQLICSALGGGGGGGGQQQQTKTKKQKKKSPNRTKCLPPLGTN